MNEYIGLLTPRLRKLEYLEGIGRKWTRRVFEAYDVEKVGKAQKEVVDGSAELKDIIAVLDLFPEDFRTLCELEDVGRGLKRKALQTGEHGSGKGKKRAKRICTVAARCKSAGQVL